MMMYLLGMGSSAHPLKQETWNAWKRLTFEYDGLRYIGSFAPLFVHQYSQAWFDFRGKRDKYADYFENSVTATEVHRRFCLELGKQFPDYSEDLWGITASDSEHEATSLGAGLLPRDRSMAPLFRARPAGHCRSCPRHHACFEDDPKPLPVGLDQVRVRERLQSPQELV